MSIHQEFFQQQSELLKKPYPDLQAMEAKYTKLLTEQHANKIFELISGIGSPLHCVFPQQFSKNIVALHAVLEKHCLKSKIFFAKKANKAQCFSQMCKEAGVGIDVASKQELELALAAGIKGEDLSVSGPEKNNAILQLAIAHHSQIAVNSIEELQKITYQLCTDDHRFQSNKHKPRILLRYQPDCEKNSRFGFTRLQLSQALNLLHSYKNHIDLSGFSFHLSGYDVTQRAQTAGELIDWIKAARTMGFANCHQINIGGGLPVKYVDSDAWQEFYTSLSDEHFHRNQSFRSGFYPYGVPINGPAALDMLLSTEVASHTTLSQQLREHNIQFSIEPGRALLDQAGISVFSIQGIKQVGIENPYTIATVEGMSFSLSEQWFGSEFLPSPILLKPNVIANIACEIGMVNKVFLTAVAGNSCLECDMVSWRKIPFNIKPAINDCLVYPNTAGYQMDSNESTFHSIPITPKVAVWFDDDQIHWQLDSNI